jgi:hypothetical protein
MAVSLAEVDRLMTDWQNNVQLISHNLLELQALPIWQMLSSPTLNLTGQTAEQVKQLQTMMGDLFSQFQALSDNLASATTLRQKVHGRHPSEDQLRLIVNHFAQPTIQLPLSDDSIAQRSLLTPVLQSITPADLLVRMNQHFIWVRDTALKIDAAWLSLDNELDQFQAEIDRLSLLATQLGMPIPSNLAHLATAIQALSREVLADPLGCQTNFRDQLQPQLEAVQQTLDRLAQQKQQLGDQFARADRELAQLQQQNQQIQSLYHESQAKVLNPAHLQAAIDPSQIQAMQDWRDRLQTKFNDGAFQPVLVGIDHWLKQSQTLLQQQAAAITANRAPLDRREELRGRLSALQAKAKARGRVEDVQLAAWSTEAESLLYSRPSPLGPAGELLMAYEQHLNRSASG